MSVDRTVQNVAYTCTRVQSFWFYLFFTACYLLSPVTWVCDYFIIINCLKVLCKPEKRLNRSLKILKGSLNVRKKYLNFFLK